MNEQRSQYIVDGRVDLDKVMTAPWRARPNDVIGGWCVQPVGDPSPAEGGCEIGDFIAEDIAMHVAELHNRELLRIAYGGS